MSTNPYQGRPLLKLVESLVMKAIGAIEPRTLHALEQMTPKLQQVYGTAGSWDEILKGVLQLPVDIEIQIRQEWERQRQVAAASGQALSAAEFTVACVDKYLVGGQDEHSERHSP